MTNEQLVARIKNHDNESENMLLLWEQNQKMITKIALKYTYAGELEDLEQEGYIGLCHAVELYDSDKGCTFLSYAIYWIKSQIMRYIENCCQCVRIPSYSLDSIRKYHRLVGEFAKYHGYSPSDREIRTLLSASDKELQSIKQTALKSKIDSLDRTVINDDEEVTLGDSVACDFELEESVIDKLDHERMKDELWNAVDSLPTSQSEAIKKKYVDGMTLKEIGDKEGVTYHSINNRISNGIRRLRGCKHTKALRMYYNEFFPTVSVKYKGVGAFQRDWTSIVEQQVLEDMEKLDKRRLMDF